jgi:hypothetical protein
VVELYLSVLTDSHQKIPPGEKIHFFRIKQLVLLFVIPNSLQSPRREMAHFGLFNHFFGKNTKQNKILQLQETAKNSLQDALIFSNLKSSKPMFVILWILKTTPIIKTATNTNNGVIRFV